MNNSNTFYYTLKWAIWLLGILYVTNQAKCDAEPDATTLYLPPALVLTPPAATTVIATPRIPLDHTIIHDAYQGKDLNFCQTK